ncbi:uncharacterized protein LOC118428642 [Branchiostoma floridae]|uniref:Uncharacterized protein LOC118428642 n=1 Tax=Branchiostoma floridae TaxID=7739 RepID=C3YF22_BRAFL|nr:uncharacterized protein LOC118428642 [Branchiostoma floridae]|eukprot:XP_002605014.1 hypothetical protein BRAFLDRAFT_124129 [Branchiostoma floridae]
MAATEVASWCMEEVRLLLSQYGSRETQTKLKGTYRNHEIYQDISAGLALRGYSKTASQCRMKVKNMKCRYRKAKEHNDKGGSQDRVFCPFFKELDAIHGNRPRPLEEEDVTLASQGGTGLATVTLKVRNDLDPAFQPYRASMSVPPRSSVYTLLLQASADDPDFTFQAEYYGYLSSHMITSINGVKVSEAERTFWRFENKKKVKFDRGVDLIGVFDGDVIMFRFKHYDPTSPDDPASDCDD